MTRIIQNITVTHEGETIDQGRIAIGHFQNKEEASEAVRYAQFGCMVEE